MATKFISDLGPKSALIAPRPLNGLTPQMLHTKFHGNWLSGSGVEDFLRFLPGMGMVAILVM